MEEELMDSKKMQVVKESIIDYAMPLFIVGECNLFTEQNATVISATCEKENFAIVTGHTPKWILEVSNKADTNNNTLVITDIEKITVDEQEKFLEILKENQVSSVKLPKNLKIVMLSKEKCDISEKIARLVDYIEV